MTITQRRYHITLVDCLPGGCQLSNTHSSVKRSGSNDYYHQCPLYATRRWTEHKNFRDERAEAFGSLLLPGVYEWSYIMRATCAGTFIILSVKAEEMYSPENFGRCATETVIID